MVISDHLKLWDTPTIDNPRMIMGLSGWMDGGNVSTGTMEFLVEEFDARLLAEILPDDFYIYNFPGPMELSALFRPNINIEDGLITDYHQPSNMFYYDCDNRLILFEGKEPNLKWNLFCDCIFNLAEQFAVREIYFIGSFAGLIPHTREPHITCTVSDKQLKKKIAPFQIRFSSYNGPCSIFNHLAKAASARGIDVFSLVAEIPAYVQGRNPRCQEAILKRLAALLKLDINLETLRRIGDELEKKIDKIVRQRTELAEHIKKLETNYDEDVFDTDMDDLKNWLQKQGIRLD